MGQNPNYLKILYWSASFQNSIFYTDDRFITPCFDLLFDLTGKYESVDGQCILVHMNNYSQRDTMNCEILLARYNDTDYENQLLSAQKLGIDIRY